MVAGTPRNQRIDRQCIAIKSWLPLAGLRTEKSVEVFKAKSRGPAVERTGGVDLPHGRVVPFAEGGRAVAVFFQHLGHGCRLFRPQRGVSGITGRQLGDVAEGHLVTVASGKQRGARGRAHGVDVETVVAKSVVGELLRRGSIDGTAKNAGCAEANVIEENQND